MRQTEALINALEEWNESIKEDDDFIANDLETIISILLLHLGGVDKLTPKLNANEMLKILHDRITYLVDNLEMTEDFLVMGCVNAVTERMEGTIKSHGESIVFHEQIIKDESSLKEKSKEILEKLKDLRYPIQAKYELNIWKTIINEYFNEIKRKEWTNEKLKETSSFLSKEVEKIPPEIKEIIKGVSAAELEERVSLTDIKNLSVEEAKKIRDEVINKNND